MPYLHYQTGSLYISFGICQRPHPIIRNRYGCGNEMLPLVNTIKPGSNFWRGLFSTWDIFCRNIIWRVGNGRDVKFWRHNWVPECGLLMDKASGSVPEEELNDTIVSFCNDAGEWRGDRIASFLPQPIAREVVGRVTPLPGVRHLMVYFR